MAFTWHSLKICLASLIPHTTSRSWQFFLLLWYNSSPVWMQKIHTHQLQITQHLYVILQYFTKLFSRTGCGADSHTVIHMTLYIQNNCIHHPSSRLGLYHNHNLEDGFFYITWIPLTIKSEIWWPSSDDMFLRLCSTVWVSSTFYIIKDFLVSIYIHLPCSTRDKALS